MTAPFGVGKARPGWQQTKLRAFLTRAKRTGRTDLQLLSVNLPRGVVLRVEGDGRPAPSMDMSGYQEVRPGDLVMNQLGKPHGAIGVSNHHGIISPAYFVADIGPSAEPRFVHHLLRTRLYISEYERRGKFMPPSQFDISWEQFRDIDVLLPPVAEQRAIADYLDAETARIDALIAKKQQLIGLLELRFAERCRALTTPAAAEVAPLRWITADVRTGTTPSSIESSMMSEDGTVEWFTPGDVGERLCLHPAARRLGATVVQCGDVPTFPPRSTLLVGIGATAGKVAFMPRAGASNQQMTAIVPGPRLQPRFLAWQLWARGAELRATAPYTTLPILNNDFVKSFQVSLPSLEVQAEVVERLDRLNRLVTALVGELTRQLHLLAEHRQALITAAVTGEFVVPGAA